MTKHSHTGMSEHQDMKRLQSRRSVLAGSTAVAAMMTTTAISLPANSEQSDAELVRLQALLAECALRLSAYERLSEEAFDRLEPPDVPNALVWRSTDYYRVSMAPSLMAQYQIGAEVLPVYEQGAHDLSLWAQAYLREGDAYANERFTAADRLRTREIMSAHVEWTEAQRQAEDLAGITTPAAAADRERNVIDALVRKMAWLPAKTAEGLAAKARAAVTMHRVDIDHLATIKLARLIADDEADGRQILALSLIVDTATLNRAHEGEPKYSKEVL